MRSMLGRVGVRRRPEGQVSSMAEKQVYAGITGTGAVKPADFAGDGTAYPPACLRFLGLCVGAARRTVGAAPTGRAAQEELQSWNPYRSLHKIREE